MFGMFGLGLFIGDETVGYNKFRQDANGKTWVYADYCADGATAGVVKQVFFGGGSGSTFGFHATSIVDSGVDFATSTASTIPPALSLNGSVTSVFIGVPEENVASAGGGWYQIGGDCDITNPGGTSSWSAGCGVYVYDTTITQTEQLYQGRISEFAIVQLTGTSATHAVYMIPKMIFKSS